MARTQYENQESLEAERAFKETLERAWHCELHKLPKSYYIDFVAVTPGAHTVIGWVEVKCRSHVSTKYPTLVLAVSKWMHLLEYARTTGKLALFAVRFTDVDMYVNCEELLRIGKVELKLGGRTAQQRDAEDVEPVIHIPVNQMQQV